MISWPSAVATEGKGAPPTRLQTADAGVYYAALPEVVYVMQGHDVAHQNGQEAHLVPFMVKLLADLLRSGPAVWHERGPGQNAGWQEALWPAPDV